MVPITTTFSGGVRPSLTHKPASPLRSTIRLKIR